MADAKKGMVEDNKIDPFKKKKVRVRKDKFAELNATADRRVQDAIVYLLMKESFYGNVLILLKRKRSMALPTMGVYYDNGFVLTYNPVFALSLSNSALIGVLKHEIFHLIFKHIARRKGIDSHEMWNLATDLAINSILKDYIPKEGVYPDMEMLKPLNLPFEKSAEFYYKRLMSPEGQEATKQFMKEANYKVRIKMDGDGDGNQQQGGQGGNQEQEGDGEGQGEGQGQGQQDGQGGGGGDGTVEVEVGGNTDVHDWENKDDGTSTPENIVEVDIKSLLKDAYQQCSEKNKMWGNTPAGLIKEIEDFIFKKSEIPWQVLFRRYVMFAKNIEHIVTRRRPNRKYGYAFPAAKVKEKLSAVAIFDTSGSVSDIEYLTCANELFTLSRILDEVNVIHCDTEPHDVGKFSKHHKLPPGRHGYGGTEFEPAIRMAEEKYNPDVIIYLTDGFASWDFKPSKIPMVWVITNEEAKVPKEHGRSVILKPDPELAESMGMAGD